MNMAIMRVEKIKSLVELRARARHNTRESMSDNVDASRSHLNGIAGYGTAKGVVDYAKKKIEECRGRGQTIRSDAVLAVEYVLTASPEWWTGATKPTKSAFIKQAREWLEEQHGKDNVVSVFYHQDETSEHIHAFCVPIDPEGKLNCKHFLGGAYKLKCLQDSYAQKMGVFGLYRGITNSKSKHVTLKQFANTLAIPAPVPTKLDYIKASIGMKSETLEQVQQRAKFAEANALNSASLKFRKMQLDKKEMELSQLASDAAVSKSTRERMQLQIDLLTRENEQLKKIAGINAPAQSYNFTS